MGPEQTVTMGPIEVDGATRGMEKPEPIGRGCLESEGGGGVVGPGVVDPNVSAEGG